MDHAAFQELIAGRALGDLEPGESGLAEGHLATCRECVELAWQLDVVLDDLALLAPPRTVPASLGWNIRAALGESTGHGAARPGGVVFEATRPARPDVPGHVRGRPRGLGGRLSDLLGSRRFPGLALASAALLVLFGLGSHALDLRTQLTEARALLVAASVDAQARASAMQVMAHPGHSSTWLRPGRGDVAGPVLVVYLPGSAQAYLLAQDLPPTPPGSVYQFWYADRDGVHAGVTFHHGEPGLILVDVHVDLSGKQAAMLTLEREDALDGQPGRDIVFGELPTARG